MRMSVNLYFLSRGYIRRVAFLGVGPGWKSKRGREKIPAVEKILGSKRERDGDEYRSLLVSNQRAMRNSHDHSGYIIS